MSEKLTLLLAAASLIGQFSVYLLSGSFTMGEKLTRIESDIKTLKIESVSQNKMQNYRLSVVERRLGVVGADSQ